jgi:hypothetical protein
MKLIHHFLKSSFGYNNNNILLVNLYVFLKWIIVNHNVNTELAIHALDQVHCWDTYFRLRIGHYGNFTPLNFQPLLLSKQ